MTKKILIVLFLTVAAALLFLSGCGSPSPASSGGGGGAYYVNAASGADTNAGTQAAPFKTITKALNTASVSGGTINVAPGTYDVANGEVFPIKLYNNVNLVGDVAHRGMGPVSTIITGLVTYTISGGSYVSVPATLVIPPGVTASVQGFDLRWWSIIVDNANATITSNTVQHVDFLNGSRGTLINNTIGGDPRTAGWSSLEIADASTSVTVQGNHISSQGNNGNAIVIAGVSAPAANLGTVTSPGNNVILGDAGTVGLNITAASSSAVPYILASGNTWKPYTQGADPFGHYPPSFVPASSAAYVGGNNYANPGKPGIQLYVQSGNSNMIPSAR